MGTRLKPLEDAVQKSAVGPSVFPELVLAVGAFPGTVPPGVARFAVHSNSLRPTPWPVWAGAILKMHLCLMVSRLVTFLLLFAFWLVLSGLFGLLFAGIKDDRDDLARDVEP
jgi:hypothetical protein